MKKNKNTPQDCTDAELAGLIESGNEFAEAEFCRRFSQKTRTYLYSTSSSQLLVDDMAQDTLVVVLQALRDGKVRKKSSVGSYVRQTAKNLLIAEYRKSTRQNDILRKKVEAEAAEYVDSELSGLLKDEEADEVRQCVDDLNIERDKQILTQHYLMEIDKATICANMDINPQDFDRIVSRARHRAARKFEAAEAPMR